MTFNPSPQQQAYFDWLANGEGNAIIESVAGSGKTTTIVNGLPLTRGSSCLVAFNKRMQLELEARAPGKAKTFHSIGFTALRRDIRKVKVDQDKMYGIAKELTDNSKLWSPIKQGVSLLKQKGVGSLSSFCPSMFEDTCLHYGLTDRLPDDATFEEFSALCARALKQSDLVAMKSGLIDFDDMLHLPLKLNSRFPTYDYLFVDEAQDTNQMRRAIAARMLSEHSRFVAVGDPHQAIFGFTGADASGFYFMRDEFECRPFPLTISYRCPRAIVAHAQQWVRHIQAHPNAPEGIVREATFDEFRASVKPGDAVLCRYNRPLFQSCFYFLKQGIPSKIEGRSIGEGLISILNRWKSEDLEALRPKIKNYFNQLRQKAGDRKSRLVIIDDREECLFVLMNGAIEQGCNSRSNFIKFIRELFVDEGGSKACILFSSVHRAKGLEWDRVWLLGREQYMPSRYANEPHELEQENNLIYVAVTRAKRELIEVRIEEK